MVRELSSRVLSDPLQGAKPTGTLQEHNSREPKHNSNDAPVTSELLRRKYTAPKAQRRSERQERIRKSRDTMSPQLNKTCQAQRSYRGSPGPSGEPLFRLRYFVM
ncbi:hypothetical protein OS493_037204 [Desmophyllum pertusum]|uniref:Uncharacterized protein n=1 Tax=Desmophyllum pertusum TaxID=174260 RepID=A0A9W9YHX9_9CNID|nr:hypothetical protein OS493_037204 [Desmophyllum pertusum]